MMDYFAPPHDTQKTSAIGFPPYVGATQNGSLNKADVQRILGSASPRGRPPNDDQIDDARDFAFQPIAGLATWKRGEATGVHAEVLIIRAWICKEVIGGKSLQEAITVLRGRSIRASQPACWCCAKLMSQLGIDFGGEEGKKPLTGWRHPLAKITIPNSDIPAVSELINDAWLSKAAARK